MMRVRGEGEEGEHKSHEGNDMQVENEPIQ